MMYAKSQIDYVGSELYKAFKNASYDWTIPIQFVGHVSVSMSGLTQHIKYAYINPHKDGTTPDFYHVSSRIGYYLESCCLNRNQEYVYVTHGPEEDKAWHVLHTTMRKLVQQFPDDTNLAKWVNTSGNWSFISI